MIDYHGLSGLDVLQGLLDGSVEAITGLHETLNVRLTAVEPGRCTFEGSPTDAHRNPHGTIHGGWTASILDGCMGLAVFSMQEADRASATATLEIKIIRPLRIGEPYSCRAAVTHSGRSLAHAEAALRDADGKLVATGTSTYAVFPRG